MNAFQFIAIPICVALAIVASSRRRTLLSRRQSLFWVFLWITAAVVISLPELANRIAHMLGIGRGADLVLYTMCFAAILMARYFYHRQRRLETIITEIVRADSIANATAGGLESRQTKREGL
jgi:small membrane protein